MHWKIFIFSPLFYGYGAIPFAYLATYLFTRKDLSKEGTGNIGVTNAFKVGGYAAGIITLLGETSKAFIPVYLGKWLFPENLVPTLIFVYCTLIGTSFSVFLRGKGGKGTTAAIWSLLLLSPYSLLILLVIWIPVLKFSRGNFYLKKIPLIFIPLVLFLVEKDLAFFLFGILTSFLFLANSFKRQDDFLYYGIFHKIPEADHPRGPTTLHH